MSGRPGLVVLAVLAAAGAAVGGYVLWPSGRHLADPCPPLHAPVPAAAKRALTAYTGLIKHAVSRYGHGGREESWHDAKTGRNVERSFDARGNPTDAVWTIPLGKQDRVVWVTYDARTYTDEREQSYGRRSSGAPADGQSNRDKVFHGRAAVVGRDVVDGRRTIHLHEHVHIPRRRIPFANTRFSPAIDYQLDTWVDPVTYVTVRARTSSREGTTVEDVSWLPRTAATLARLELAVPHGFELVHLTTNRLFATVRSPRRCA